jgi:CPA2 family monovalent cation:H+ antiporter-2
VAHEPVLISTIAVGLTLAFVCGLIARRLRLPVIVGYLLAGIFVGPFTPGLLADQTVATELAELGVILLMFGVGIHFSIRDLLSVKTIAVPGAFGQILVATVLGTLTGLALGWDVAGAVVLGLAISVASTVVLLRALMERGELNSTPGRVAVGWLIVEDLFTVVVLVLLPSIAPLLGGASVAGTTTGNPVEEVGLALAKATLFALLMIVVGIRVVPWLLRMTARQGSRELFTLAVLATALGIAYLSYAVFGVSLALGAFLAGAVVGESDLSHQAAADALPLQDAFAVLFFVSVGMLVDPTYLMENPLAIVTVLAVVVVAKALAAFAIVALLGQPPRVGLTVAAGLAQVGEFSFILATLGLSLALLPDDGFQLVVAASVVSITLNPFLFRLVDPLAQRLTEDPRLSRLVNRGAGHLSQLDRTRGEPAVRSHAVICGFGRVGRLVSTALDRRGFRYVVISDDRRQVEELRERGVLALYGDAANIDLLREAHVDTANVVVAAVPSGHAVRLILERARAIDPRIALVARTHSEQEAVHLREVGGDVQVVHAELELAVQMTRYTLRRFGLSTNEAEAIAQGLRSRGGRPWGAPTPLSSRR